MQDAGRPNRDQLVVLVVFLGVVAFWLTEAWHGMETGIVRCTEARAADVRSALAARADGPVEVFSR